MTNFMEKKSGFVNSRFMKTCGKLVIEYSWFAFSTPNAPCTPWVNPAGIIVAPMETPLIGKVIDTKYYKGSFNNYVDKKRGRGVSQKSTREVGSLECPRGLKPSFFREYFIPLCTVMGGKKWNNYIKLSWTHLN